MYRKQSFLTFLLCAFIVLGMTGLSAADNTTNTNEETMSQAQELLKKADELFNSREYTKSRSVFEEALKAAEEAGSSSDKTEALAMIARTYLILDDKETGYQWLKKAHSAAEIDEPAGWARFIGVRGRFLWQDDKKEEATVLFENMYDYCNEHELYNQAVDAAHMIAITGDVRTQIEWAYKGIKAAEAGNYTRWLGPLWNNLGATYEDLNQNYEALESYVQARKYHYMHGTELNKAIADWAVGHMYIKIGEFSGAWERLLPLLPKFEELKNDEFVGLTCKELGEVRYAEKNYKDAIEYYERAELLLREAKMPEWDADGFQYLLDKKALSQEKLK
ncbi:MAG: hypothetical protein KAR42_02805 [candidate division Zixibacteria bacterium]|nr:hypothetical protein [candidate division Zixibacteria bacterium]